MSGKFGRCSEIARSLPALATNATQAGPNRLRQSAAQANADGADLVKHVVVGVAIGSYAPESSNCTVACAMWKCSRSTRWIEARRHSCRHLPGACTCRGGDAPPAGQLPDVHMVYVDQADFAHHRCRQDLVADDAFRRAFKQDMRRAAQQFPCAARISNDTRIDIAGSDHSQPNWPIASAGDYRAERAEQVADDMQARAGGIRSS